ncbi:hypothetical protein JW930_02615 [Candidatus Woesearchaeota archaeon]|nr:hypothetical protein [Candidatus Woesearchaeota archaeon]
MPKINEIPYDLERASGLESNIALEIQIPFGVSGLTQEELVVLSALSEAVDGIAPIFAQQQYDRGCELRDALVDFGSTLEDSGNLTKFGNYMTVFLAASSPWNMFNERIRFPFTQDQIPEGHSLHSFADILWGEAMPPQGRGLYPWDMTHQEYEALGPASNIENSTVIRGPRGTLEVVLNEKRFGNELGPVISALERAERFTSDTGLARYIRAKIVELETGLEPARKESWRAWIQDNVGKIGFILGTGVELYLDKRFGVRGAAQAIVYVRNERLQSLADTLAKQLPEMEQLAPWKQKIEIDPTNLPNLPNLQFVDVLRWAGFYNLFPGTVSAESLPDDEAIVDQYGSVNIVLVNTREAIEDAGLISYVIDAFLPQERISPYRELLSRSGIIMTAAHELGHRTGVVKDNNPKQHFGEQYSILEEARAEVFSMWSLPFLVAQEIITEQEEIAGYYDMLISMLVALKTDPIDHNGSRNLMFHYFLDREAIIDFGDERYDINLERIRVAVQELLGILGDIRAEGDLQRLEELKRKYIRTDKQEVYRRKLAGMPYGRAFIFPGLHQENDEFSGELIYPPTSLIGFVQPHTNAGPSERRSIASTVREILGGGGEYSSTELVELVAWDHQVPVSRISPNAVRKGAHTADRLKTRYGGQRGVKGSPYAFYTAS